MAENRALAFDIVPIPRKVVLSPDVSVGEKYQCSLCLKTFAEQQHFTLHKNIHYFETPFRCKGIHIFSKAVFMLGIVQYSVWIYKSEQCKCPVQISSDEKKNKASTNCPFEPCFG